MGVYRRRSTGVSDHVSVLPRLKQGKTKSLRTGQEEGEKFCLNQGSKALGDSLLKLRYVHTPAFLGEVLFADIQQNKRMNCAFRSSEPGQMLPGPGQQVPAAEESSGAGLARSLLGEGLSDFLTATHGMEHCTLQPSTCRYRCRNVDTGIHWGFLVSTLLKF